MHISKLANIPSLWYNAITEQVLRKTARRREKQMKAILKRTIAAAVCVIMCAALCVAPTAGAETAADLTLDDVLNVPGGSIHFVSEGESPFVPFELDGMDIAVSTAYDDYHNSVLTFTVDMAENSSLTFDYYVQQEDGSGEMYFTVNGDSYYNGEKLPEQYYEGWMRFVYIAPEAGSYDLQIDFGCPRSEGGTFAALDNFVYAENAFEPDYAEALNGAGAETLQYMSFGSHLFGAGMTDGFWYVGSTNCGEPNSVSALLSSFIMMNAGDKICFDYLVMPCEDDDYFVFHAGNSYAPVNGYYENFEFGEWHTMEYEIDELEAGPVNFSWKFVKGSAAGGQEEGVLISNVRIIRAGSPEPIPGDVDGSGTVAVADAIMALRASMGIIELTPEQFACADMNGDGSVAVGDAITILRRAMGIA